MITHETRYESFSALQVAERKKKILSVLYGRELTAREIASELHFSDLNAVKPRLTELCHANIIEPVAKKYDAVTDRNVSVYRVVS